MLTSKLSRRRFLTTTAASTAVLAMPHVRGAHAAGKLSIGFWDHWVPAGNVASQALVDEWAAKEKVEVSIDDITAPLIQQNGAVNATVEYLGRSQGHWIGVPATSGSQIKGPCSRIDLMK